MISERSTKKEATLADVPMSLPFSERGHAIPPVDWVDYVNFDVGHNRESFLVASVAYVYSRHHERYGPLEEAFMRVNNLELKVKDMAAEIEVVKADLQRLRLTWAAVPTSDAPETIAEIFRRLSEEWRHDTAHLSADEDIAMHPAYQQIIGLGAEAVPLILKELQTRLDHWFWALSVIARENPVPDTERGKLRLMRERWLEWGRQKGYID